MFQSPSLRGSGRFRLRWRRAPAGPRVSIPFIAGQWSLRRRAEEARDGARWFQSPSLRGSGRFIVARALAAAIARGVSIPFIAGQWSLRHSAKRNGHSAKFQSPSLRGSGRFGTGPTRNGF